EARAAARSRRKPRRPESAWRASRLDYVAKPARSPRGAPTRRACGARRGSSGGVEGSAERAQALEELFLQMESAERASAEGRAVKVAAARDAEAQRLGSAIEALRRLGQVVAVVGLDRLQTVGGERSERLFRFRP